MNSTHSKRYTEFEVDPSIWDKERPLGVSGIIRCQNSADFLEACVESCIDGLDELIAVYHNCTDETVPILNRLLEKYPDKIRIYEYLPYVYPIDLADEQFSETLNLPLDSVHLLSGYTNFAISKAKYRYAIKIDSDQIFFKEQFKEWCDAYRSQESVRIYWLEDWAFKFYKHYTKSFKNTSPFYRKILNLLAICLSNFHFSYLRKRVIRDKVLISLSGINLFWNVEKWFIALGDEDIDTTYRDILCPFNGVRDLFFFKVSAEMTYKACHLRKASGYNQVLEVMFHQQELFDGGLIWFHMRPCLCKHLETYKHWYNKVPDRFLEVDKFRKFSYWCAKRKYQIFIRSKVERVFAYFYSTQRNRIPWADISYLAPKKLSVLTKINSTVRKQLSKEFKNDLCALISSYMWRYENQDGGELELNACSLRKSLFIYLYAFLSKECFAYCISCINGCTKNVALSNVRNYLEHFSWSNGNSNHRIINTDNHPWYELLSQYKGCYLVYVSLPEELFNLKQFLCKKDSCIFLLCEFEPTEKIEGAGNIVATKIEFSDKNVLENDSIEQNFPYLFQYANAFLIFLKVLLPLEVICFTSRMNYKKELLLGISDDLNINIKRV